MVSNSSTVLMVRWQEALAALCVRGQVDQAAHDVLRCVGSRVTRRDSRRAMVRGDGVPEEPGGQSFAQSWLAAHT